MPKVKNSNNEKTISIFWLLTPVIYLIALLAAPVIGQTAISAEEALAVLALYPTLAMLALAFFHSNIEVTRISLSVLLGFLLSLLLLGILLLVVWLAKALQ